jgi:hypothetical protein
MLSGLGLGRSCVCFAPYGWRAIQGFGKTLVPMKLIRLLGSLALTCLIAFSARSAEFEGTLTWTFSTEITDVELKAKMAESQKEMADPAKLAQMKASLENPQMKAMMEQNPQMRAAMEAQIKMAEDAAAGKGGGDMLTSMMPKAMTLRTKAAKTRVITEGGAMPMEIITRPGEPDAYLVNRQAKSFSKLPLSAPQEESKKMTYKVTKGGGAVKILGYSCDEYIVELTHEGRTIRNRLWATNDIPGLDTAALSNARFGGQDAAYLREIDGLPLRVDMTHPQMRMKMEATSIKAGPVSDEEFELPDGFVEKPFQAPFAPKTN